MPDNILNKILINVSSDITLWGMFLNFAVALLLGIIIGITYIITQQKQGYQKSYVITLVMLPIILSVIILFIGSNIARAFSLSGTLAIIRYRSVPGDPKDIGYVFFATGAGLACGVGFYGYGVVFVVLLSIVLVVLEKTNFAVPKKSRKILKITVPEDLNYQKQFNEVLKKYTSSYEKIKVKTTELGSLFELVYNVTIPDNTDEFEMINELRCLNGNLSIILTDAPYLSVNM